MNDLIESFFHPVRYLLALRDRGAALAAAPRGIWLLFAAIAVAGSILFGASAAWVIPALGSPLASGVKLMAAAGIGWIVLGPLLLVWSRLPAVLCAHACLLAMVYGEAILEIAVLANFVAWRFAPPAVGVATAWNAFVVGASNALMAWAMVAQLKALGFPPRRMLALWFGVLNPVGAAAFWMLVPF
ncbi:MAG: hypothetical protein R3F11_11000 [Verrucomicrobiales bacterium]